MIANQLRQHGYTARLHVISNGISPEYIYGKREKETLDAGPLQCADGGPLRRGKASG